MERITNQGRLSYRTKLMEQPKAKAFAAALSANPRFSDVRLTESSRGKSVRRFFVEFLPSNDARVVDMLDRQQDARSERAGTQAFSFVLDKDGGRPFVWCHSHGSGEVYELDTRARSCNCPDHEYRCRPHDLRCKHQLALIAVIAAGDGIRPF